MSLCLQDHDRAEKRRKDEEVQVTAHQVTRLPTSHRMASWCGTCIVLLCALTSSVWLHLTCTSLLACLSSGNKPPPHNTSSLHVTEKSSRAMDVCSDALLHNPSAILLSLSPMRGGGRTSFLGRPGGRRLRVPPPSQ